MRALAEAHSDPAFVQQVVARLPSGYVVRLLESVKDDTRREWNARQAIEHCWSRNVLQGAERQEKPGPDPPRRRSARDSGSRQCEPAPVGCVYALNPPHAGCRRTNRAPGLRYRRSAPRAGATAEDQAGPIGNQVAPGR
jgi:hypothetical protein